MTSIIEYIRRPAVFSPETVVTMGDAYERALASFNSLPPKALREVIAARFIELARRGERDPHLICESALAALRMHRREAPSSPAHP